MFGFHTTGLVISLVLAAAPDSQHAGLCWRLDKTTVAQGGCVTIIVQEDCCELANLALQIDERERVKLLEGVGPVYHVPAGDRPGQQATLVLLYVDLMNPEGLEELPGQPGTFRFVPVFETPGTVQLALFDGKASLGSKEVTVVPRPSEAHDAIRLLMPPLSRKTESSQDKLLWSRLIMARSFGVTPPLTDKQMKTLRDQYSVIRRHPDWTDIAEMHMARVEASYYIQQVSEDRADGELRLRDAVETPAFPTMVRECMTRPTQSAFVRAIQGDIRNSSAMLTYLLRGRERERGR